MEEKIAKPAGFKTAPEQAALVEEVAQKLHQSYQELEQKFSEVTRTLDSTTHQLKQTQAEKDKTTFFLDNILDSLNSGVIVLDLDQRVTLFNRAAEQITGYALTDTRGQRYSDIFSSACDLRFSPLVTLSEGRPLVHEEKEFVTKSGQSVSLGFSTASLKDKAGNLLGAIEVFVDLSKIKSLEEELARVKTLAAVGEMAAMVSHEIRNPLGGIAGFADLLDQDTPESDPRKRYVKKIIEGVEILNKTVGNLLAYAKPVKLALRRVEMTEFLDEVVGLFEMELRRSQKRISIKREYGKKPIFARIDPEQFQQVILNLLQNSAQAVNQTGVIELALDMTSSEQKESVCLRLSDNGPGMPPEVLKKIFTPFYTSKETGTGLGLATVKKIMEAHQGEVRLKSEVGQGTEVEIWLPRE
jgi:PAS domain S-box-containing protein